MKKLMVILSIFNVLASYPSFAQDDVINEIANSDADGNDITKRLLKIPEVQTQFEACKKEKVPNDKLDDCLWNGISVNGVVKIRPLTDDLKSKVQEELYGSEADATQTELEIETADEKESQAIKKLKEYFQKKLTESLYGEDEKLRKLKSVDHKVFTDIFRAQLGKNLISAMSSYCIDADSESGHILKKDDDARRATRKENMGKLSKLKSGKNGGSSLAAYSDWNSCIVSIQHICHQDTIVFRDNPPEGSAPGTKGAAIATVNYCNTKECTDNCGNGVKCVGKNLCDDEACDSDDLQYSTERACAVTTYLKKVRSNLVALDSLDANWDKVRSNSRGNRVAMGFTGGNGQFQEAAVSEYSGKGQGEKTIDQIVSMSSQEAVVESGFEDGMKEDLQGIENCIQGDKDNLQIINTQACEKFLNTDHEKLKKLIGEYSLRSRAIERKLQGDGNTAEEDEALVKNVLSEEGFNEEQIEKELAKFDGDANKLKAEIRARYDKEREAMVKSFAAQLEGKTSTKDGVIENKTEDKKKLAKIRDELTSNAERYKELVHFNNIVSGFLTFGGKKDKDGKPLRNTASLKLELEGSAYAADGTGDANGRGTASAGGSKVDTINQDIESIRSTVEQAGVKLEDSGDAAENSSVGKEELNSEILYYGEDSQ